MSTENAEPRRGTDEQTDIGPVSPGGPPLAEPNAALPGFDSPPPRRSYETEPSGEEHERK